MTLVLNHWFLWLTWKFSFVKPNIWKSFTSKQTKQKWNDIFIKFSFLSGHINQIFLKKEDTNDWIRQSPSGILTHKKCNTIINCLKFKTVSTTLFYWDRIMWFSKCLLVAFFFFIKFFDEVFTSCIWFDVIHTQLWEYESHWIISLQSHNIDHD